MPSLSTVEKLLCEQIDKTSSDPTVRQYRKFASIVGKYREPSLEKERWIENYCFIENKNTKKFELIKLNEPQKIIARELRAAIALGLSLHFVILKARRWGISRFMLLSLLHDALLGAHFNVAVVANTRKVAGTLLDQVKTKLLPNLPFSPPLIKSNANRVSFAPPMSTSIEIASAQEAEPLRGDTMGFHRVHCTETAFWEDAKAKCISINQTVADAPGSMIGHESTANGTSGIGSHFHDMYWTAKEGGSDMKAFFFPWYCDPTFDYCLRVNNLEAEALLSSMDDEEEYLMAQGVNVGSLAWRRWAIINKCDGDKVYFDQEYPSTDKQAFRTGGLRAFSVMHLEKALEHCHAPLRKVDLEVQRRRSGRLKIDIVNTRRNPCLSIWAEPEKDKDYVIGADAGEGVGGDFSVAHVLCVQTNTQVAKWSSNEKSTTEFARALCCLSQFYNDALTLIERKQPGQAVIASAAEYADIHLCQMPTFATANPEVSSRIGWDSNTASKPIAYGAVRDALREQTPTLLDAQTIGQMAAMRVVQMPSGYEKYEKAEGYDDDEVDAWSITLMCRRFAVETCYYDPERKPAPRTYDEAQWADFMAVLEARRREESQIETIVEDAETMIEFETEEVEDESTV